MKDLSKIKLGRLNLLDLALIFIVIVLAVLIMFKTGGENAAYTYDGFDISLAVKRFNDLEQQGYVVTCKVYGVDAKTGQPVTLNGRVIWGGSMVFLIDDGKKLFTAGGPAALYEDVFIKNVVLTGTSKKPVTDLVLKPKNITGFKELLPDGIPIGKESKIFTQIVIKGVNQKDILRVVNELRAKQGYVAIYPYTFSETVYLNIDGASAADLAIASEALAGFDGLSSDTVVRLYGLSPDEIKGLSAINGLRSIHRRN